MYIYVSDSQLVRKHLSGEEYPKKEEIPAKPTRRRGQKDMAPEGRETGEVKEDWLAAPNATE